MAWKKRIVYIIDEKQFLKCSMCWEIKEMTENLWYKCKSNSTWYYSRCKECHDKETLNYYNSNKDMLREKGRRYYSINKEKIKERRKSYDIEKRTKFRQTDKYREYMKLYRQLHKDELRVKTYERARRDWHDKVHHKTQYLIKKLWIRPDTCPICWYVGRIEAHHPNYENPYEIIRACNKCHQRIHNWCIECPKDIINLKKES